MVKILLFIRAWRLECRGITYRLTAPRDTHPRELRSKMDALTKMIKQAWIDFKRGYVLVD